MIPARPDMCARWSIAVRSCPVPVAFDRASVRAAQALILGSKARALLQGRTHVSYDDVRALALPVLRHRILLNFQAQSEKVTTETLITKLVAALPTPRAAL